MKPAGNRALVTGASSGIGAATAARLAECGCRVVLLGRDRPALHGVARWTGGEVVVADLATPAGLARACDAAVDVDLLVSNAGAGYAGPLSQMPPETVSRLVALNLDAPLRLARAALSGMRARGRGHLVFVSSIAAVGVGDEAVYSATKAGVRAFAASLRQEAPDVGVTTVLPGAVRTPFFARRGRAYERRWPRPVEAAAVANALVRAVEADRCEVFVPGWLTVAARMQGLAPGAFERLARRFG